MRPAHASNSANDSFKSFINGQYLLPFSNQDDKAAREELERLAMDMLKMLCKPAAIDGSADDFLSQHKVAVEAGREQAINEFMQLCPHFPLEVTWEAMRDKSKTQIDQIQQLNETQLAAFVNATSWGYAREGTQITGRFSADRIWHYVNADRETVARWMKPLSFQSTCASCRSTADVSIGSASAKSFTRPTIVRCRTCGHTDTVGRPTQQYSDPTSGSEHRLKCGCRMCADLRSAVAEDAAEAIDACIEAYLERLRVFAMSAPPSFGTLRSGYLSDYLSDRFTKCEELLAGHPSLSDALHSVAGGADPYDHAFRLAHLVEAGVESGWLSVAQGLPEGALELTVQDFIRAVNLGNKQHDLLGSISSEMKSGDAARVAAACGSILRMMRALIPTPLRVSWEGRENVGRARYRPKVLPDLMPEPDAADSELDHDHPEATPEPVRDRFRRADDMLSAAATMVDARLGEGTASRCPELVAEMLRLMAPDA